jgi:cell division ATPase FtsA
MPLFPFLKSKRHKTPVNFLVVDIGASDVKCLVFETADPADLEEEDNNQVRIVGVGRQNLERGAVRGGVIIEESVVAEALGVAMVKATRDLEADVTDVIFGVGGDLCIGFVTTARINRGKSDVISKKEVEEINKRIMEAAEDRAQLYVLQSTGNAEEDLDVVTSVGVYAKLDGEVTQYLVGSSGSNIEISMFTAFTPSYYIKSLVNLSRSLGLNILALGPKLYSLSEMLKKADGESLNCVIINVGDDYTDVGVVFGGGIVSTKSIPIGGTHFLRALSLGLGLVYDDAQNLLRHYVLGKLSDNESATVQNNLREVLGIWLSGVELLFSEFSGVKTFAPTVYAVGGGFDLPDIYEVLSTEPWTRSIPFKEPPEFKKFKVEDIVGVRDLTGKANSLEWVLPASLSQVFFEVL